jgi:hypothetical protein
MSDYTVVSAVSETLKTFVWSMVKHESEISFMIGNDEENVCLDPPFLLLGDDNRPENSCLSIYLYRILENGDMKNRPLERQINGLLEYPPLALNLYYLITPLTGSVENDQRLLTKTMQIFYDHAILVGSELEPPLQDNMEELRIALDPLSIEDITRIWSGFLRPYYLSVSYEVKVIYVDSKRQVDATEIRRKRLEFVPLMEG